MCRGPRCARRSDHWRRTASSPGARRGNVRDAPATSAEQPRCELRGDRGDPRSRDGAGTADVQGPSARAAAEEARGARHRARRRDVVPRTGADRGRSAGGLLARCRRPPAIDPGETARAGSTTAPSTTCSRGGRRSRIQHGVVTIEPMRADRALARNCKIPAGSCCSTCGRSTTTEAASPSCSRTSTTWRRVRVQRGPPGSRKEVPMTTIGKAMRLKRVIDPSGVSDHLRAGPRDDVADVPGAAR